ncbi:MAG: Hsp70 family protein [Neomegalonema sp.]|nr:Hsp70 family protein [Neomegalonema sp.]
MGTDDDVRLLPVEGAHHTLPSALFYPDEAPGPLFGRAAIAEYLDHEPGRLLRGLKSILTSDLINETTRIGRRRAPFTEFIVEIIRRLRSAANAAAESEVDCVVLGRPVNFVGAGSDGNQSAEDRLRAIAQTAGFKHVEMQLEPIAAAFEYEMSIDHEELVLIVDIGGGTTDFSVVRVAPERRARPDRSDDILAHGGVGVGGTDLDRSTSLNSVMPLLGLGAQVKTESGDQVEAPRAIYYDLATWHRVMFAYTPENLRDARATRKFAAETERFDRLIRTLESQSAHALLESVEQSKIRLTTEEQCDLDLAALEPSLTQQLPRAKFEAAIAENVEKVRAELRETLKAASLTQAAITSVFLTGGTSHIPAVKAAIARETPTSRIKSGDMLGSVGRGLGLYAQRIF